MLLRTITSLLLAFRHHPKLPLILLGFWPSPLRNLSQMWQQMRINILAYVPLILLLRILACLMLEDLLHLVLPALLPAYLVLELARTTRESKETSECRELDLDLVDREAPLAELC
jgi:hypothetical protein